MHFAAKARLARLVHPLLLIVVLYGCWLGMLITHECGHVLHAWLSGVRDVRVELPLLGFSRTDLSENPHPQFVAWGGAIWGCLLPLGVLAAVRLARIRHWRILLFFAGFGLLANAAYLSVSSFCTDGDAADLLRHGAPQWTLLLFGAVTMPAGLLLWHRLCPRFGLGTAPARCHK